MKKQTVLITGCSSGIGFQTAKLASEAGHHVIATALNEELLADVPSNVALKLVIDICDETSILKAVEEAIALLGPLTCLVNNAGYGQPGPVELVDSERLRRQFEVNVFGTMAMTRSIIPHFRAAGKGRIITLSSMLGLVSMPYQGVYCASKHAIEALFDALRVEVKQFGIDTVLIEPGFITTSFLKTSTSLTPEQWLNDGPYAKHLTKYFEISTNSESDSPKGMAKMAALLAGSPEDVAKKVIKAMEAEKPRARYPVTAMAKWLPRLAAWLPTGLWDFFQEKQSTMG